MSEGADAGPGERTGGKAGASAEVDGGASGDPDASASGEPDASASRDPDARASGDPDAGASAEEGGADPGEGGGAASLRVHATKTSATQAGMVEAEGLTDRERKAAFVLVEHSIVSLRTMGASSLALRAVERLRSRGPAGYKARVIRVSHLTKRYGAHLAVDDVSFEVGKGEVVGFLGPNGAGKSTTLRILAGFLGATSGQVAIDGHDVATDSSEARRSHRVHARGGAALPRDARRRVPALPRGAQGRAAPGAQRRASSDAMTRAAVLEVANKRIEHLSKGYRQRVGLADAIVGRAAHRHPRRAHRRARSQPDPRGARSSCASSVAITRSCSRRTSSARSRRARRACCSSIVGSSSPRGPPRRSASLRGGHAVAFVVRGDAELAAASLRTVDGVAEVVRSDEAETRRQPAPGDVRGSRAGRCERERRAGRPSSGAWRRSSARESACERSGRREGRSRRCSRRSRKTRPARAQRGRGRHARSRRGLVRDAS